MRKFRKRHFFLPQNIELTVFLLVSSFQNGMFVKFNHQFHSIYSDGPVFERFIIFLPFMYCKNLYSILKLIYDDTLSTFQARQISKI